MYYSCDFNMFTDSKYDSSVVKCTKTWFIFHISTTPFCHPIFHLVPLVKFGNPNSLLWGTLSMILLDLCKLFNPVCYLGSLRLQFNDSVFYFCMLVFQKKLTNFYVFHHLFADKRQILCFIHIITTVHTIHSVNLCRAKK